MYKSRIVWGLAAAGAMVASADAQFYTGFELPQYNASPAGTVLTGQQSWYLPVAGSVNGNVNTYAGNTYGFVQNPVGGNQFATTASTSPPPGTAGPFARAQIDVPFASAQYTVAYDFAGVFSGGTPPSAANLSSFSLNHPTLAAGAFRGFIALNNFIDFNNPSLGIRTEFNVFNAAGTALNNQSPGAAWTNLQYNHWYRQYVTFNLATNEVTTITLVDLHNGTSATANPVGWYMNGGAASTLPLPASLRLFGGGPVGNVTGWDNVELVPTPGTLALLGVAGVFATRRRR
jgi:hypothetical protein